MTAESSGRQVPPSQIAGDDPAIVQAMTVWKQLTPAEQANVFGAVMRAVTAFGRTKNVDHLVRLAESIDGMVLIEQQPGFVQARRAPVTPPARQGEALGIAEVIRQLQE